MKTTKNNGTIIKIIALVVFILIISETAYIHYRSQETEKQMQQYPTESANEENIPKYANLLTGNAVAQDIGVTTICINNPPEITEDCNLTAITLYRNESLECQFNASDANGNNVTFRSVFLTIPEIFNITSDGYMNFSAGRDAQGQTNVFRIYAEDDSGCNNNYTYKEYNLTVYYDNQAPYLYNNLQNVEIIRDHYYSFYLSDYFLDPDGDQLSYFSVLTTQSHITITTIGDLALIRGDSCGETQLYYVAVDYGGLTANSNVILYNITCPDVTDSTNVGQQSSGSGGEGSGNSDFSCAPEWRCSAWGPCRSNNESTRRCLDYNGCTKYDYERYFYRSCTYFALEKYCVERWDCNEWSTCEDGTHSRNCIDMSNCGSSDTKPWEIETCNPITECFNGVQDTGETGVDCGGQCGACRNIESPRKNTSPLAATIIALGITVGITALAAFAFRANLLPYLNKVFVPKPMVRRKVYINLKQKERLIQMLNIAQARLDEDNTELTVEGILDFIHEYFKQLLAIEKLDKKELVEKLTKLKDKDLERILVMFYAKVANMSALHYKDSHTQAEELQSLLDEMTHNVYLIAGFTDADAITSVKDRPIESGNVLDIMYGKISNIYIALNFNELLVAKNMYREVLQAYSLLPKPDKTRIYNDIIRAFHAIDYLEKQFVKR